MQLGFFHRKTSLLHTTLIKNSGNLPWILKDIPSWEICQTKTTYSTSHSHAQPISLAKSQRPLAWNLNHQDVKQLDQLEGHCVQRSAQYSAQVRAYLKPNGFFANFSSISLVQSLAHLNNLKQTKHNKYIAIQQRTSAMDYISAAGLPAIVCNYLWHMAIWEGLEKPCNIGRSLCPSRRGMWSWNSSARPATLQGRGHHQKFTSLSLWSVLYSFCHFQYQASWDATIDVSMTMLQDAISACK